MNQPNQEPLDENDKLMALQIKMMMETPAWKYLQAYTAAQWNQIIDDASKARTEPHWRSQQGKLRGFKMCWEIPFKLVERFDRDTRQEEESKKEQPEAERYG